MLPDFLSLFEIHSRIFASAFLCLPFLQGNLGHHSQRFRKFGWGFSLERRQRKSSASGEEKHHSTSESEASTARTKVRFLLALAAIFSGHFIPFSGWKTQKIFRQEMSPQVMLSERLENRRKGGGGLFITIFAYFFTPFVRGVFVGGVLLS